MCSTTKNEEKSITECALCGLPTGKAAYSEGEDSFCCHGCHAVYMILSTKGTTENYRAHPLFNQAVQSGLISNPALLDEINQTKADHEEISKYYFEVTDMWCPSCAEVIKLILLQEKGVINCVVDYCTDLASVEYSPRHISKEEINKIIMRLGYSPQPLQGEGSRPVSYSLLLRFILAAFCSLNIMMFSYPLYANYFSLDENGYSLLFAKLSFVASLPVVTVCLWPIIRRFINSLFVGFIGMEALVITGVFSAFGLSIFELYQGGTHVYFDSMSVIVTLVLLGKIIESKAKFSSKDSLLRLARSTPKRARKHFGNGEERFVSIKDISVGDLVKVVTGEKIVLDGEVTQGEGACEESLMTGESLPRKKHIGDKVLGGTLLQRGSLIFRVTSTTEESALQKILDAVNFDIGHKTVYVRAADQIVKYIAPAVILISFLTGLLTYTLSTGPYVLHEALIRMASVLLISCPCAIGIAAPLAESSIMHALANVGALVRNRGCLPLLGKESVIVFDKTGTITEGNFFVRDGLQYLDSNQLSVLKAITSHSNHPIAVSTYHAIPQVNIPVLDEIREISGMGMIGKLERKTYLFGSAKFLRNHNCDIKSPPEKKECSTISYFYEENKEPFPITLGDKLRNDAAATISSLYPTATHLLSGDSFEVVKSIANSCNFTTYKAEYLPLQKKQFIDNLKEKGNTVCMIGDGINDAPALTSANIGMSVVSATDISIHVSDIVLTTDKLSVIPKIREIGRKGQAIVKQNLFWAFFYNSIGIGLAVLGYLTPIYAAFAMASSSLIVIINARRIQKSS